MHHHHQHLHHDNSRLFTGSFMSTINNNIANSRTNNNSNISTTNATPNRHRANRLRYGRRSTRPPRTTNTRNSSIVPSPTSHNTAHNTTNVNSHNHNRDYNSVPDDIIRAASTITGLTDISTIRSYGTRSQDLGPTDQAVIPPHRRRRLTNQTIDNLSNIAAIPTPQTQSQSQTLLSINDQLQQLQQISDVSQQFVPTADQIASTTNNNNNRQQRLQFLNQYSNRDSTGNSNIPHHMQSLSINDNQDALAGNTDAKMNEVDQHNTLTDSGRKNRRRHTHTRNLNLNVSDSDDDNYDEDNPTHSP